MANGEPVNDPIELAVLRAENAALRKQLEEITKTSSQYLQNVAHQLTAPLNAIKWSIEAIRKPEVPIARKGKLLSSIYSQGTILVHLIKNFALMSNLEADLELGQFRDKPEQLDLIRLAINLANDFEPQAAEKGQHIDVNANSFSQALNGRTVMAVKNLIAQALSNLLENAVKYADLRTVIGVSAVSVPYAGGLTGLGIRVSSKGIPLRAEEIKRVLERGFRGAAARSRVPAGTGIGLYLAKRIMEIHQGTIVAQGHGAESFFDSSVEFMG
jgi:two-component system sensor histidine kinase VanS